MSETEGPWVVKGPCRRVQWARDRNGSYPGFEFYNSLDEEEQAKALGLFRRLADSGRIQNKQQFKKLEEGLWEFKPTSQVRLFGDHRPGGRFLVAYGVKKKKWKHSRSDLNKAQRVLAENDELEGRDEQGTR